MTYPGEGWGGQPQPDNQGQPPAGWSQQPTPQPGQFQPQFPQQPYQGLGYQQPQGQPYSGQPPFQGQQQFPTTQYPVGQQPYMQQPAPPKRRRTGLIVGVVVAVVVAAGAGVGTWFALNHSSTGGSASPQDAATKLMADVGNGDVLGIVGDLPPAEASLMRDTVQSLTDQMKRLQVLKPNANPQGSYGARIATSGITFDNAAAERINDHLTITKLVAGKITIGQALSTNDFTDTFLHNAFPNGAPSNGQTTTIDIASEVRQLGHPIRIATEKVGDHWYPSLFYTIADAALQSAHKQWPTQSIPAAGAGSADDAVRQFVQAASNNDVAGTIARTAPDEMAALHDAGQVLVDAASGSSSSTTKITNMQFSDRSVAGGTDTVLTGMDVSTGSGQYTITQSGGCYSVQSGGQTQRFCASDLTRQLQNGPVSALPPALTKLVTDMVTGMMNKGVGVVATQVNGQWYVSPGRTITQLVVDMYGSITPDDVTALFQLGNH